MLKNKVQKKVKTKDVLIDILGIFIMILPVFLWNLFIYTDAVPWENLFEQEFKFYYLNRWWWISLLLIPVALCARYYKMTAKLTLLVPSVFNKRSYDDKGNLILEPTASLVLSHAIIYNALYCGILIWMCVELVKELILR